MRLHLIAYSALLLAAFPAWGENISAYSDLVVEKNCTQFDVAEVGNGDCQRRSKSQPLGGAKVGHLALRVGNVGRA